MTELVAHLGAAVGLVGAAYSGCDRIVTVTLLTLAVGLNGASFGGFGVNHVDIAANHASVLMGITNTFSNMCGFVAPWVAGLIINNNVSFICEFPYSSCDICGEKILSLISNDYIFCANQANN